MRSLSRVAVIGPGGSGKSTLAEEIALRWGVPAIHMDDLLSEDRAATISWSRRPKRNTGCQRAIIAGAVAEPGWIIEGSYWRTVDILLDAAELVVFLDPPVHEWLAQLLKREGRAFGRWLRHERARGPLMVQAQFLLWQPWYLLRERPRLLRALGRCRQERVVHLRGQRALDRFVAGLKADKEDAAG